jgi:cyclase
MTRGGLRFWLALLLVVIAFAPALAQQPMTLHTIKEGKLYWVAGGGGNSGVIIGATGVVVVDAKSTVEAARWIVAEIAKLTPKPITHVIVTHSDGDHINGLPGFPSGIGIVGHANNKLEQQAVYLYAAVEVDGGRCLPPKGHLPNQIVFKDRVEAMLAGERFAFHHFGPAHTSGDLVVHLPDEKIVFAGDLITSSVLVHPEKNGSLEGWFASVKGMLDLDADRYLGGHAMALDTRDTLRKRLETLQALRDNVDGMVRLGKSLAEIKAAMGDPPKDPSGCRGIPYPSFGEISYHARVSKDQELK